MKTLEEIGIHELKDLLLKNWMTHDGMWFAHCVQALGIDRTNELNKAAIRSLAGIEVKRARRIHGIEKDRVDTFEDVKDFIAGAFTLGLGDFMGGTFSFPGKNVLRWQIGDQGCFAYRGIKRLGVIDRYQCGVLYRVFCWLDNLGVQYSVTPQIDGCLFHASGTCAGRITFAFS